MFQGLISQDGLLMTDVYNLVRVKVVNLISFTAELKTEFTVTVTRDSAGKLKEDAKWSFTSPMLAH